MASQNAAAAMPRRMEEYGRHGQLRVPDLLGRQLLGHLVGERPHVLRIANQVDDRQVDLDEVREIR